MPGFIGRITPVHNWDNSDFPEKLKNNLKKILDEVFKRAQKYDAWGFGEKLSFDRNINAVFTGKRKDGLKAAEILAGELEIPLFLIDFTAVITDDEENTGPERLKQVFRNSENQESVLLFDIRKEIPADSVELDLLLSLMSRYRGLLIFNIGDINSIMEKFAENTTFLISFS